MPAFYFPPKKEPSQTSEKGLPEEVFDAFYQPAADEDRSVVE